MRYFCVAPCMRFLSHVPARNFSNAEQNWPKQIFSAIQPSGEAHLGNYLGAIRKWVDFQNSEKHTVIFAIADLHSITMPKKSKELRNNIFTMAATLLACGIDLNKSILFQQSVVPQHAELCWILGTITTMARLSRLPQYKEKKEIINEVSVGIFLYPILQAADIMLYRGTHVPVGEDQVQHIELANHLVKLFNKRFGETFPEIAIITDESSGRIKSLSNPTKKMSKSDPNNKSWISLMDSPDEILKKCKKSLTDCQSEVTYEPETRPGISNLLLIHSSLSGKTVEQIVRESEKLNTGEYKIVLAETIIEYLKPIRKKITEYLDSHEYLMSELEKGADKARGIAEKTMKDVREKVGFDVFNLKESREIKSRL